VEAQARHGCALRYGDALSGPPTVGREFLPAEVLLLVFATVKRNNCAMSDHVYKKIELVGSSPESIERAIENALARAQKTIRNMRWLEVMETRGHIEDGKIDHWQVAIKVGFTLDG
jgi:flavin-binding protein dodecin